MRPSAILLLMSVALSLPCLVSAQQVGEVCSVKGEVRVKHEGAGTGPTKKPVIAPCHTYDTVQEKDVLTIGEGASVKIVLWKSNEVYEVNSPGQIKVQNGALMRSGTRLQPAKRIASGFLRPLRSGQSFREEGLGVRLMAGGRAGGAIQNPSPVGATRSTNVTLRWQNEKQAEVQLVAVDRTRKRVIVQLPLKKGKDALDRFTIPATELIEGNVYEWSVTGLARTCKAVFRILTLDENSQCEEAEKEAEALKQEPDNAEIAARLLPRIYERFGLLNEAADAYRKALEASPEDEGLKIALERVEKLIRTWTGVREPAK